MIVAHDDIDYTQERRTWPEGDVSEVIVLRFPAAEFRFDEIDQPDREVKLSEIGYLRAVKALSRGVAAPCLVLLARLERDSASAEALAGADPHTEEGEALYSANSLLLYTLRTLLGRGWLRHDGQRWQADMPPGEHIWRERARAALALLEREDRLRLYGVLGRRLAGPVDLDGFDARKDLVPVGRLGFLRDAVRQRRPRVAFNTAFFLLEHDDYFSHHSALGEAYNLYVRDGAVSRPPLYRRAAFYQTADGRWHAGHFSMAEMTLRLPDGTELAPVGNGLPGPAFALNPENGAEVAVYTRTLGLARHGRPLGRTALAPGRAEFTVIDTRVVGYQRGGGLDIPQNGLVLSFAPGAPVPSGMTPAGGGLPHVRYGFAGHEPGEIRQAIQAGPVLVERGRVSLSAASLFEEDFWPAPTGQAGDTAPAVVPTDYPDDVDRTRAGRIGLGVDDDGRLVVVAAPGTERGARRPDGDAAGATLIELAELLAEAGAVEAINLDGGGSTQLFYLGGLATVPGNRFRIPGVLFERMIPAVGVLV